MMFEITVFGKEGKTSDEHVIMASSREEMAQEVFDSAPFFIGRYLQPGDEVRVEAGMETGIETRDQYVLTHENELVHMPYRLRVREDQECPRCGNSFVVCAWSENHFRCNGCGAVASRIR